MNAKIVSPATGRPLARRLPRLGASSRSSRSSAPKSSCGRYVEVADYNRGRQQDGLVFYSHTLCPYAQRVWLTLEEKGLDFTLVHLDLSNKPSWYRSVHPSGLVPAVEYGGQVVTESDEICQWLEENFAGPQLMPSDSDARDFAQQLVQHASTISSAGLRLLSGSTAYMWSIGSSPTQSQISAFEASLEMLGEGLDKFGGPFLVGDQVTLADVNIFPFMERFALAAPEFSGYNVRDCCDAKIGTWLDAMEDRRSGRITMANRELLLDAMRMHKCLHFIDFNYHPIPKSHPHIAVSTS